jgi:hypothetical protein
MSRDAADRQKRFDAMRLKRYSFKTPFEQGQRDFKIRRDRPYRDFQKGDEWAQWWRGWLSAKREWEAADPLNKFRSAVTLVARTQNPPTRPPLAEER